MGIPALFAVKGGISLSGIGMLSGVGVPGGSGGLPDDALLGATYMDSTNGTIYQKKTTGLGTDKWVRLQNQDDMDAALIGLSWREPVKVNDSSTTSLAAAETALNSVSTEIDGVPMVEGDRILFSGFSSEAPNVYIVEGNPSPGPATLVEDINAESKGDALFVQSGTDAGKQFSYNGTDWVQQGGAAASEIGYLHTFIGKSGDGSETPDYASTFIAADGDSLETAIGKIDAEIGESISTPQVRLTGKIYDRAVNQNIKSLDYGIGPDVSSTNHISAGNSINVNISALDTAIGNDVAGVESRIAGPISAQNINANIEALDGAIGPTPTSLNIITNSNSVNDNLSTLDIVVAAAKTEGIDTNLSTVTTIDTVQTSDFVTVEWTVHVVGLTNTNRIWTGKILAIHDGISVAYNISSILELGGVHANLSFDVVVETGQLKLKCTPPTSENVDVRVSRSTLKNTF